MRFCSQRNLSPTERASRRKQHGSRRPRWNNSNWDSGKSWPTRHSHSIACSTSTYDEGNDIRGGMFGEPVANSEKPAVEYAFVTAIDIVHGIDPAATCRPGWCLAFLNQISEQNHRDRKDETKETNRDTVDSAIEPRIRSIQPD